MGSRHSPSTAEKAKERKKYSRLFYIEGTGVPAVRQHLSQYVASSLRAVHARQPECTAQASKQAEPVASSKAPTDNHQEKPFYSPFASHALAGITTSACNWPRHENKTSHRARSAWNINTSMLEKKPCTFRKIHTLQILTEQILSVVPRGEAQ